MHVGGGVDGKWRMWGEEPSGLGHAHLLRVPPVWSGAEGGALAAVVRGAAVVEVVVAVVLRLVFFFPALPRLVSRTMRAMMTTREPTTPAWRRRERRFRAASSCERRYWRPSRWRCRFSLGTADQGSRARAGPSFTGPAAARRCRSGAGQQVASGRVTDSAEVRRHVGGRRRPDTGGGRARGPHPAPGP